ncbi:hypothetical protein [uncultured Amphritea sp.]|uniref:hypothetical protein n=1 Tax=uncultured Amphritea sp. TaxID=981605 RepID=UPI002613F0B9|nr:hypothetical protein [uncultured Amphritea sp.]
MIKIVFTLVLMSVVMPVNAEIYKCKTNDRVVYQSTPCQQSESGKVDIYIPSVPDNAFEPGDVADDDYKEERRLRWAEEQKRLNERSDAIREERLRQERFKKMIWHHEVAIGMTKKQAERSWGKPCDINRSVYASGVHEQWVYCTGKYERQYLYFEGDELTGMN